MAQTDFWLWGPKWYQHLPIPTYAAQGGGAVVPICSALCLSVLKGSQCLAVKPNASPCSGKYISHIPPTPSPRAGLAGNRGPPFLQKPQQSSLGTWGMSAFKSQAAVPPICFCQSGNPHPPGLGGSQPSFLHRARMCSGPKGGFRNACWTRWKRIESPNSTATGMHVPGGWRGEPLFVLSSADTCVKVLGPRGEPGTRTLRIVLRTRP